MQTFGFWDKMQDDKYKAVTVQDDFLCSHHSHIFGVAASTIQDWFFSYEHEFLADP